jgi:hypothetical protein
MHEKFRSLAAQLGCSVMADRPRLRDVVFEMCELEARVRVMLDAPLEWTVPPEPPHLEFMAYETTIAAHGEEVRLLVVAFGELCSGCACFGKDRVLHLTPELARLAWENVKNGRIGK